MTDDDTIVEDDVVLFESHLHDDTIVEDDVVLFERHLRQSDHYQYYFPWQNASGNTSSDFESNLIPPSDVSVDAVVSSLYFNTIVFVILMGSYEVLRRLLPAVYSSRQRIINTQGLREEDENGDKAHTRIVDGENPDDYIDLHPANSLGSLPDQIPLDWIGPVFGIPWDKVREKAGLDGYFFLR